MIGHIKNEFGQKNHGIRNRVALGYSNVNIYQVLLVNTILCVTKSSTVSEVTIKVYGNRIWYKIKESNKFSTIKSFYSIIKSCTKQQLLGDITTKHKQQQVYNQRYHEIRLQVSSRSCEVLNLKTS